MLHQDRRSPQQGEVLSNPDSFHMTLVPMMTIPRKDIEITFTVPLSASPGSMESLHIAKAKLCSVVSQLRETFMEDPKKQKKKKYFLK